MLIAPVYLTVEFSEALAMLKEQIGIDNKAKSPEILDLLQLFVLQYFDLPVSSKSRNAVKRYEKLIEDIGDLVKDLPTMETQLSLLVMSICREYLPNFRSYLDEDCKAITECEMEGTRLRLAIQPAPFSRFVAKAHKHDNPFSS